MTYTPGSIHQITLTGLAPWDIPGHILILALDRVGPDTILTGIVAEAPRPVYTGLGKPVRGTLVGGSVRAIHSWAMNAQTVGIRIGSQAGAYDGDIPLVDLTSSTLEDLVETWGPVGDDPCDEAVLAIALARTNQRVRDAREWVQALEEKRDALARRMLDGGVATDRIDELLA